MDRQIPNPGEVFKHFKGNCYKILAGKNSTITDPCIRPLEMFMSEVGHKKYPSVKQKFRFEEIKEC